MKKETTAIILSLKKTLQEEPWYGQPVMAILNEIDPSIAFKKPSETSHSLIELIYHMITWTEFAVQRLEKDQTDNSDALDWREIDPKEHSWEKGLAEFKTANDRIIELLESKEDSFLEEKVDFRKYNFRDLVNGLIQHHIYHLGQIAYIKKLYN